MTERVEAQPVPDLDFFGPDLPQAEAQAPESTIHAAWMDGEISDLEAVRLLAPHLRAAERAADAAQARVDGIKEMLRAVYTRSGQPVISMPEFDLELVRRNAYDKYTVDHKVARAVVAELKALGEPEVVRLAKELEAAIKMSVVAGGVTVGRPKK